MSQRTVKCAACGKELRVHISTGGNHFYCGRCAHDTQGDGLEPKFVLAERYSPDGSESWSEIPGVYCPNPNTGGRI